MARRSAGIDVTFSAGAEDQMAERRRPTGKTRKSTTPAPQTGSTPLGEQIEILIGRCIEAIENDEVKLTISDLIRLRKLRQEMWPEKRIVPKVTWVDGWEPVDPNL